MLRTTGKQDWATPWWFYRGLWLTYEFQLDAAASKDNAKCPKFYTEQDNGLALPWISWTFCNPPWGNIRPWLVKAREEQLKGNYSVLLLPANGMTSKWYRDFYQSAYTRIFSPRVAFVGSGKSPNGGVMTMEFGSRPYGEVVFWDVSSWKTLYVDTELQSACSIG